MIAKVRANLEKSTPPSNPEVVGLAKRWRELVGMFSGVDSAIEKSVAHFYRDNPDQAAQHGVDG